MKQATFASLAFESKKKLTRRERFLAEMDQVVPWAPLLKLIARHYPKAGNGRQPMPLETMLRIYFLQQWFNLSDPAAEDSLYDIESLRRFCGIELSDNAVPDETTILNFRRLLEQHRWYFGMKVHIGTDAKGIVHTITTPTAKEADITQLPNLLHGQESVVHGDRGYCSRDANAWLKQRGVRSRLQKRASTGHPLTEAEKARNQRWSKARAFVEHPFLIIKRLWGLAKNTARVFALLALANLYRVRRQLLPQGV